MPAKTEWRDAETVAVDNPTYPLYRVARQKDDPVMVRTEIKVYREPDGWRAFTRTAYGYKQAVTGLENIVVRQAERITALEGVLREFIADCDAVGPEQLINAMEWPTLAHTYEAACHLVGMAPWAREGESERCPCCGMIYHDNPQSPGYCPTACDTQEDQ